VVVNTIIISVDKDIYLILANHLEDIHHALAELIMRDPKRRPSWTVTEKTQIPVEELAPLIGLVTLLNNLAKSQTAQEPSITWQTNSP
jgi:hypothetical protein